MTKKPTLQKSRNAPTETALWARIRNKLNGSTSRAYRVETIATPGFPDVVWVVMTDVLLIELKAGPIRFRASQEKFIKECERVGVTVWVIWQRYERGEILVFPAWQLLKEPMMTGVPLEAWIVERQTA